MRFFIYAFVTTWLVIQPAAPSFRSDWSVVLPADGWKGFYTLCSRPASGLTGYWAPDPETIRNLEADLAVPLHDALLREVHDASWRPATHDYYRQYIGIQAGGRHIVYVNGFHRSYIERVTGARPGSTKLTPDWRTRLVNMCDGGSSYFGAEYDPATRKVSNIYFNGGGTN